jgi:diguanylate cyclase (GGDEF)-like protein
MRPMIEITEPARPLPPGRAAIQVRALPFRHRGMILSQPGVLERVVGAALRALRIVRARMHEDFRLAVLLLCGVLAVSVITPFALFRFAQGEVNAGLIDLALLLTIVWANLHAWRTGRTFGPGLLMMLVNTVGCLAVTALVDGLTGIFWAYTAVLMNFFMTDRLPAAVTGILVVAGVALVAPDTLSGPQLVSFVATAGLVGLYAYIFAIRASRQADRLEDLAQRDPLTGIGNRRLMELDLAEALDRAAQGDLPRPAVAVLDLDHFKQVNDRHGHEAGDQVIIDFAAVVRSSVRRGDRLYRLGGEEFVLLLTDVDTEGLRIALAKIQTQVRARLRSPGGPVTTSIGACLLGSDDTWQTWLARADQALYAAKHGGRNRSVLAPCEDEANYGRAAA